VHTFLILLTLACAAIPRTAPEPRAHERVMAETPSAPLPAAAEAAETQHIVSCLEGRGLDAAECRNRIATEGLARPSRRDVEAVERRLEPVNEAK